jgi:hypothetical protein
MTRRRFSSLAAAIALASLALTSLAAEPAGPPIAPLTRFAVPAPAGGTQWATLTTDATGRPILLIGPTLDAWILTPLAPSPTPPGPTPPGPTPPGPTPDGIEKVALDAANALPADPKRAGEAAGQAKIFDDLAGAIDAGQVKNPEQLRLQLSVRRTEALTADRITYWAPWAKAWGAAVNAAIAAGTLKEMPQFAALCRATAAGLRKVQ